MGSLLPDESFCKSELGSLVYKSRKYYGFNPEIEEVKEPLSFFGHVEYTIRITATPNNSIEEEPKPFHITTRFKELNNLYIILSNLHRQLYLKGTFPPFVQAKLFGSTTPETIAERKNAILEFFKFVLSNEVLCKSKAFQQFIEGSHLLEKNADEANNNADTTRQDDTLANDKSQVIDAD